MTKKTARKTPTRSSLTLRFTGRASLVLELDGYGPMELRVEDEALVLDLVQRVLESCGPVFDVAAYDRAHYSRLRDILG